MNVLFICGYAAEYKGNFIECLTQLDIAMHGKQQACYIFPPEAKDKEWVNELQIAGAKVYFNTNSILGEYRLQNQICKEHKIDIIYHHFWNLKDCIDNRLLKIKYPKLKMVIHHHNEYHISNSKRNEILKHWILDADMHIGCGEYVSKEVIEAGFRNVKWVDNCIEFSRLDCHEPYDMGLGLNLLTFSSYSYEAKGIDISIKACFEARKQGVPVNLFIAIATKWEEMEQKIVEECKRLNGAIPEWIKLLPPRSDIATYYRAADAYLNSSRTEGFCYASVEAVYCGAQIIQSNHPGNRLDIPRTLICSIGNVGECVNAIEELYQRKKDGEIKEDHIIQKKYILDNYSISTWTKKVAEELTALM